MQSMSSKGCSHGGVCYESAAKGATGSRFAASACTVADQTFDRIRENLRRQREDLERQMEDTDVSQTRTTSLVKAIEDLRERVRRTAAAPEKPKDD